MIITNDQVKELVKELQEAEAAYRSISYFSQILGANKEFKTFLSKAERAMRLKNWFRSRGRD